MAMVDCGQLLLDVPAHEAARALIRAAGVPIVYPSANISTKPSPTTADAVLHDMMEE